MRPAAAAPPTLVLAIAHLFAGAAAAQVPTCTTSTTSGVSMTLTLSSPLPGTLVTGYEPCPTTIRVEGTATLGLTLFDFYFVIDSSGSTGACTGTDIDGDGIVGRPGLFGFACDDPGDSVLAAEVKAVRDFVVTLDPATSRVAIIQFSDPDNFTGGGERQLVVQSLTNDFALVGDGLDTILAFGSAGATDYGGGVHLLIGEATANGDPFNRQQHAYFLSDGVPTFPDGSLGSEDPGDSQAAIDAADEAGAIGLSINTFGVGFIPSMTQDPVLPPRCEKDVPGGGTVVTSTLECMALRTGGLFFASTNPADIVDQLQLALPPTIASVVVTNDTTGQSVDAQLGPDGAWSADVPILQGVPNDLHAVARADDGTSCRVDTDYTAICFAGACDPRTQGYWHRQCMGLGEIEPNHGPGRGGFHHGDLGGGRTDPPGRRNPPPHPDWDPDLLRRIMTEIVDPLVRALGSPADQTTCEGLAAVPPSEMCQKAIKQYTALRMNMASGKLNPTCVVDLSRVGDDLPTDAGAAADLVAQLIITGLANGDHASCVLANDIADAINTGDALR